MGMSQILKENACRKDWNCLFLTMRVLFQIMALLSCYVSLHGQFVVGESRSINVIGEVVGQ
jgi:hypothetical protein